MNIETIKDTLDRIHNELDLVATRREELLKESRSVISFSSRSIVKVHTGNFTESSRDLDESRRILSRLRKTANQDLKYYLIPAETEYVEAVLVKSIAEKKTIPSQTNLEVSKESYLLGLLDTIGELKRMVYDSIRKGQLSLASEIFDIMENFYIQLSPLAIYDNIVQGYRRKLDIARRIIEDTRSAITEEIRRTEFIKSINKLSDQLPTTD